MSSLTISQGLRQVARLKGKIAESKTRLAGSVFHRDDQPPAFQFSATVERLKVDKAELIKLESRIALTNASTKVEFEGRQITLSEGIKRLQEAKDDIAWLKAIPCQAASTGFILEHVRLPNGEYGHQKASTTCHFTEQQRSDEVDKVQAAFDALNDLIEKKNHETELVAL